MSLNLNGQVIENKAKYINEQGGTKLTYNFVTDPRIKRGHNFGIIYVTSSNYEDTQSIKGKPGTKKDFYKNYKASTKIKGGPTLEKMDQNKNRNEKEGECGICTQKVISTVRPTPITFEEIIQTDPLPEPPQPLLIWQGKTGEDKGCQIEDGDLFNFDEEVQPLVHIIVSKTLEESRREVLEEEELRHIKEQQDKYKKLNDMNINRIKSIEDKEKKRFEEHNRKKELKLNKIKLTKLFQKKLQSRMKAKQYILKLKQDCFESLGQQKVFKNKQDNYYFTDLLPELHSLAEEDTKNDYLIVNKLNKMFTQQKKEQDKKRHADAVLTEKKRLENNERIRIINQQLAEKHKKEEKERREKRKHDRILDGYRKQIQEDLVTNNCEWAEETIEYIFDINGYYQKTRCATLTGGPIGQMALILSYLDKEMPEFFTEDKVPKIIDVFLEKSHAFYFLWSKEDLEKYKEINENIETIEDILKASDEEYKEIITAFFNNTLVNDDMLQIFFEVCKELDLGNVKDIYLSIFSYLLNKFKEGGDFGQVRFLEVNTEQTEEIPLLCVCLLNQEIIPLDTSPPDQSKNRGKKKFSFETYYSERTLIMPTISDKLKIIKINKNFEKNYRNNFLECIDIMYGLEPDKLQVVEDLKNNYDNFIKGIIFKLSEKYQKEIVDMTINYPREEDEVLDTEPKQQNKETE